MGKWYNVCKGYEEDTQMKPCVRRLKLTDYEIRVLVNALNDRRIKRRKKGLEHTVTDDLILRLLDMLDKT